MFQIQNASEPLQSTDVWEKNNNWELLTAVNKYTHTHTHSDKCHPLVLIKMFLH